MGSVFNMLAEDIVIQDDDPRLYPGQIPLGSIRMFPQTIITTSEFDFLRRDALLFIDKLKKCRKLLEMSDMPGVIHGYECNLKTKEALWIEQEMQEAWKKYVVLK